MLPGGVAIETSQEARPKSCHGSRYRKAGAKLERVPAVAGLAMGKREICGPGEMAVVPGMRKPQKGEGGSSPIIH